MSVGSDGLGWLCPGSATIGSALDSAVAVATLESLSAAARNPVSQPPVTTQLLFTVTTSAGAAAWRPASIPAGCRR